MGLSHIPTGSLAANQAYFLIAALAWNLKTWMLNLLELGDGAVLRYDAVVRDPGGMDTGGNVPSFFCSPLAVPRS